MINVVLFGTQHVGKSTLAGLLYAEMTPDFNLMDFTKDVERDLKDQYDAKQQYAYIVDRSPGERRRDTRITGRRGTSLNMHVCRIGHRGLDIGIVDTPGAEWRMSQQLKGMLYGEVGVFMIEAKTLLEEDPIGKGAALKTFEMFFSPLYLWRNIKKTSKMMVVISKMDEVGYDQAQYARAEAIIREVLRDPAINVLPSAIDLGAHAISNVVTDKGRLSWFAGPTVLGKLEQLVMATPEAPPVAPLFGHVDRAFEQAGRGLVIRSKLYTGTVQKGATVQIAPVELKRACCYVLSGRVGNIRDENEQDVEETHAGSIVGFDLLDLRVAGRRAKEQAVSLCETACLFGESEQLVMGAVLDLVLDPDEASELAVGEAPQVIWFGRAVPVKVLAKSAAGSRTRALMELDGEQVALPANDGLAPRTFIILKNSGPYMRSHLAGLGAILELRWRCNLGTPEQAAEHLAGLDFTREGDEFVFSGMAKYGPLVTILRKYCRRFSAEVDPLQETVTVRMSEEWGVHTEAQESSTQAVVPDAHWEDASLLSGESE